MEILHIGSCAGVTNQLVAYGNAHGHQSDYLVTHFANKWGHHEPDKAHSRLGVGIRAALRAPFVKTLIFHENTKRLSAFSKLNPNIFLYAHGVELRNRYAQNKEILKRVRHIFVATRDLLEHVGNYPATYIPNPVSHIFNEKYTYHDKGLSPRVRAFTFNYGANEEARALAREKGLELDVIERNIPYTRMPEFMRGYTHYVDVKRWGGKLLTSIEKGVFSMSGLEALASGLYVIMFDGCVKGLPAEHRIEYSGKLFLDKLLLYGGR